ncbi:host specificity factor TipJ family phage tail protein [Salipiger sp.]|uniref:host specificity factor TipJ family phage tail protein n=1 Tax=Salipiger sp. TaxID=2078585 RepID=UPI003A98155B
MINIQMPVGCTITEVVQKLDLETERYGIPMVTMIRGGEISVVPLDMWSKTRPKLGTDIQVTFPKRDPGSIALIASLAIPQAATAIAGAFYAAGTVGYALIAAAVTIVGTLLVQALIPPAKTEGGGGVQNYAITGTANAANPYGVFPSVLGRHRIYPPLTATGYSENAGQDVYYYGRMTFGYGPLALEDLRIGTTPITEFAAAEVELEFRNVDRDLTLAAMPALADFVINKTGEDQKPRFKLAEVGKSWIYAPRSAADQVMIKFDVSAQDKVSGYTFIVEEAVAGSGSWAQVESFTLQDPETDHGPLSGLQDTRTFTSASYSDGVEREYRVTLTGSTPRTGDPLGSWLTLFNGRGVDAVTITEASATYHEVQKGWRYGTESMFLYPEDITQDDENALPEPGAPVVRYTREASSAASVDISFSRGLYDGTSDGLESKAVSFEVYYQPVAGGIVEEDWVLAASPTFEAKATTALRYTVPMSFPEPGQYAIKVERVTGIDYSTRDQDRAWVTAIRSMGGVPLPSPDGIAEVAFKIKASDQLNGRLDSLNGIVQQLAPVWNGSAWTDPQPVRHPAWLYAQALRGPQQRRPVADSRLDLDALKAWADQEPHWTCDYVIDTPTQTSEVLDVICAAGRARRTLSDFRWSVIRDGAAGPVRQTFTPRNSWGYTAKLVFPREIHGFRVKARSERLEWEEDEILVLKDGFTPETATELETLPLAGTVVTADDEDEGNAYRLGRYHLAVAENRPETHTFFADWEHIRVHRGDKIRFVHDVPMIGVGSARIKGITEDASGNVATVMLDELFDFNRDSFRLAVRNVQAEIIFQALSPEDPRTRTWTPQAEVRAADIALGDLVAIEETEQVSAEMLVTGIYPRKDESAKITCVDAAPGILQAAVGEIPVYSPIVTNPRERADYGLPPAPVVISAYSDSTTQMLMPDLSVRPRVAVQIAPFATRSASEGLTTQMRWREAGSGAAYTYGEAMSGAEYSLLTGALDEGVTYEGQVRITGPDGQTRGWKDWPNTVVASVAAPAPPQISATATAANVPDADGNGRRPAIALNWTMPANRTLRVTWELRIAATGVVVQRSLFAAASEGTVLISDGVLPATAYQVRASFVSGAADLRSWGDWLNVTTDDLRISRVDLDTGITAQIDEASNVADQALQEAEDAHQAADNVQDELNAAVNSLTVDYDVATQAAQDAQTARDESQIARDNAATHAANSDTARQLAQEARDAALGAKTDAEAAATEAETSYDLSVAVTRDLLPSTFKEGGRYWTHNLSGDPDSTEFVNRWGFKRTIDDFDVAHAGDPASNIHLGPKGYVDLVEGHRYRMTVEARCLGAGGSAILRLQWRALLPDYTAVGPLASSSEVMAGNGGWQTFELEFTYTGTSYAYAHPFVYLSPGEVISGSETAQVQVRRLLPQDVTESYEAEQSAEAAATSKSEASAFADDAGEKASSATTAANNAATSASGAVSARDDAVAAKNTAEEASSTAVSAAETATNAKNDAGESAEAASTHASAAASSATTSTQKASAASNSANTATTKAGEASTSAQEAAAAETRSGESANAAAIWESVTAKTVRENAQPSHFEQDGKFWSYAISGNPDDKVDLGDEGLASFRDTDEGRAAYVSFPLSASGNVHCAPKGYLRNFPGATFRIRLRARYVGTSLAPQGGDAALKVQFRRISANYGYGGAGWTHNVEFDAVNTWQDFEFVITDQNGLSPWMLCFAYWNKAYTGSGEVEVVMLGYEEITSEEQAKGAASAASESASSAAASESGAAQSASAANTSKNTASTKAGEASTSAGQAATSASNAAGSANSASSYASQAASSRDDAADSAQAASVSASNASTSKSQAASSAQAASSGAQTASTQAGLAGNYAGQAAISRDAASDSAVAASNYQKTAAQIAGQGIGCLEDAYFDTYGEAGSMWQDFLNGPTYTPGDNEVFATGKTLNYNYQDTSVGVGVRMSGNDGWKGPKNEAAYVVEVVFTYVGGSGLGGAGILIDWNHSNGESRQQFQLSDMITGYLKAGVPTYASKVFKRPAGFPGNFTSHDAWFMVQYTGFAESVQRKHLKLHYFQIRPATPDEIEYLDTAATVEQHTTAIATLDGKARAGTGLTATATSNGNTEVSEIRLTSYADPDGSGGSAVQLRGDDIIADGTLTTRKLAVGLGGNLLSNDQFWAGTRCWDRLYRNGNAGADTYLAVRSPGSTYAGTTYPTLMFWQNSGDTSGYADLMWDPIVAENGAKGHGTPAQKDEWFEFSFQHSIHRCEVELRLQFLDADGNTIGYSSSVTCPGGSFSNNNPNEWPRTPVRGKAPAGTAFVRPHIRKRATESGASSPSSYLFFHKPMLSEVHAGAKELVPYSPGGATYIDGGTLINDSILSRHVAAGTMQADRMNTDSFAAMGLALFGGNLRSVPFTAGSQGWRITNGGSAEFNDAVIRRQVEVAAGTLNVGDFSVSNNSPGIDGSNQLWAEPSKRVFATATPIPITAWGNADRTYIVTASMVGEVTAWSGKDPDVYWGWEARVLPLTRWSGNQSLRLCFDFWTRNIGSVDDCQIQWKLYAVS